MIWINEKEDFKMFRCKQIYQKLFESISHFKNWIYKEKAFYIEFDHLNYLHKKQYNAIKIWKLHKKLMPMAKFE